MKVTIVNPDDTEELALTLEGKKKKLKWEHFERLGKKLGLNDKQLKGMAKRFVKNKPIALEWINTLFYLKPTKKSIKHS